MIIQEKKLCQHRDLLMLLLDAVCDRKRSYRSNFPYMESRSFEIYWCVE
ncbi:MAG: hypothetical protein MUE44_29665 [Oscillatoriaceae cyanobacterium Prado104]|nr:hypothetical protein [Oscillatoriaceae cyanobacterium Prado104]